VAGSDSTITLTSGGGAQIALPSARCSTRHPVKYCPAANVPVEVRGAGPATRQVTNFGVPGVWDHAERLICCELITPPGNWSSYPPHKHDPPVHTAQSSTRRSTTTASPGATRPPRAGKVSACTAHTTGPEHEAAGLDRLDETIEIRDGDVVLVPRGYHGPCVAAPGYPMYYLNVLAGPGPDRSMAFCDDPTHTWVRDSWADTLPDPRCPVTSAALRLDGPPSTENPDDTQ
jgi:5-deoxy-glucuronate isomerase